jgi:hypothetical protein
MDLDIFKWLAQQGGAVAIAGLIFWFCRQDRLAVVETLLKVNERTSQREEILIRVLERHAGASEAQNQGIATLIGQIQASMTRHDAEVSRLVERLLDEREQRRPGS